MASARDLRWLAPLLALAAIGAAVLVLRPRSGTRQAVGPSTPPPAGERGAGGGPGLPPAPRPPRDPEAYRRALETERRAADLIRKEQEAEAIPVLREAMALHERAGTLDASRGGLAVNLAAALYHSERPGEAAAALDRWLDRAPEDGEAWRLLAKIQFHRGLLVDADRALERARAILPPSIVLVRMAMRTKLELAHEKEALSLAREALKLDPRGEETAVAALETLIRFHAYDEARPLVERLRAARPDDPIVLYASGVTYRQLGRDEEAERDLRRVLDDPDFGEDARVELATLLAARGRAVEAIPVLAALLERDPYAPRAYFQLSLVYARAGEKELAERVKRLFEGLAKSEDAFADARELEGAGKAQDAAIARARGHRLRGELRDADEMLRDAEKELGATRELRLERADLYRASGRYREMEVLLREIGGASPPLALRFQLARALRRQGQIEEAAALLEAAATEDSTGEVALERATIALEDREDPEDATRWFEAARDAGLERAALLGLARAAFAQGRWSEVERLLRAFPDGEGAETARLWRARAAARSGDPARARALLEGARRGRGYLGRLATAEIRAAEGDAGAAREVEALEAREARYRELGRAAARAGWPEAAPTLVALSRLARDLGEIRDAAAYARLAVQADPGRADAHLALAALPGNPFLRLHSVAKVLENRPNDAEARRLREALRTRWKLDGTAGAGPAPGATKR